MAEGTIYKYFKNKEDLLIQLVARLALVSLPEIGLVEDDVELELAMESAMTSWLCVLSEHKNLLKVVIPEIISHDDLRDAYLRQVFLPAYGRLLPYWRERLKRHGIGRNSGLTEHAMLVFGAFGAFLTNEYLLQQTEDRISHQQLARIIVDMYFFGIAGERVPLLPQSTPERPNRDNASSPS